MKRLKIKTVIEMTQSTWAELNNMFLEESMKRGIWSFVDLHSNRTDGNGIKFIRLEIRDHKFIKILNEKNYTYKKIQ